MRICCRLRLRFGKFAGAFGLILLLLPSLSAMAAESGVFTVSGISVDETDETAAKARETALQQGHVQAFQLLLEKIVLRPDLPRVPQLTADQIAALVLDFAVDSERNSPVRYLAELSFRFKPRDVKRFLSGNGIGFAETESKPLLVLTLYGPAGQTVLWETPNPWFVVWAARRPSRSLVPLLEPLGDLSDVATIGAAQALAGDADKMAALQRRYGAGGTLVTQAIVNGDATLGEASVLIISRRHGEGQSGGTVIESYRQEADETIEALLQRSREAVVAAVQESWKRDNLLQFGTVNHLLVTVNARELSEWLEIKRRLDGLAAVESARVTRLRRGSSEVDVAYVGDERQLAVALAQRDLELLQASDLSWELRLKPTQSQGDPAPVAPQTVPDVTSGPQPSDEEIIPAYEDSLEAPAAQEPEYQVSE